MDSLRTLLALASLLVGVGLAGLALWLWRSSARRVRAARVALVYGCLFVSVGIVLGLRESDGKGSRWRAPSGEQSIGADTVPIPQAYHEEDLRPRGGGELSAATDDAAKVREDAAAAPNRKSARASRVPKRDVGERAAQPVSGDPLYSAMLRAFDRIEAWFYKYGSPAPSAGADGRTRDAGDTLSFPDVSFETGTANLTPESRRSLGALATHLRALSGSHSIDIQAHVSGPGPEPFNYILTQARAEVVRDFLVNKGVDGSWLTTSAMGSEGVDSLVAGSRIRFEVRR